MNAAVEAQSSPWASQLALVSRFGGKRADRLLAAAALAQAAAPIATRVYRRARRRDDFTITVPATDDVYPALHEWVLERMPESDRKALIATTTSIDHYPPESSPEPARVRLRYDGNREQSVSIEGHRVNVAVMREEMPSSRSQDAWARYLERITFTARTVGGRDAVVRMIARVLAAKREAERPPAVYLPSRWGGDWTRRGDLPTRSLDSTILKAGQLERLTADLASFIAAEDDYNRLSQPWHRGYLFHGAPGTGKTSVARALANHFSLPTYYLPLGDIARDTNLMQLVAAIPPRSVLLLEDVDAYHAATSRTEGEDTVSIAAMLNALDGIWTPPGLVTILTTNHRERLDAALLRAGRVDVDEEFTVLDAKQARRMLAYFEAGMDPQQFVGESPAVLIEAVRKSQIAGPRSLVADR